MINTLYASQQMRQLLVVAFRNCNIPCCSGNPLQPFLPRVQWKHAPGQEQNLGMVKIERIWQSACLLPKQIVGRQRLNGCGYCKYMQCLRYSPLLWGNSEVFRCLQQLNCFYSCFSKYISSNWIDFLSYCVDVLFSKLNTIIFNQVIERVYVSCTTFEHVRSIDIP